MNKDNDFAQQHPKLENSPFYSELKEMLSSLLDSKIDINISFQKVVEFNSKYNIVK